MLATRDEGAYFHEQIGEAPTRPRNWTWRQWPPSRKTRRAPRRVMPHVFFRACCFLVAPERPQGRPAQAFRGLPS